MGKSSFVFLLVFISVIGFYGIVPAGCANIIPPSGGPKDSTAPQLVSAFPKDSTVNFQGNRITFTFDEYIDDPQDLSTNLLFTPTFEVNPEIAIRARTMTLRFRDSLLPNTTYTFNFGNAIRDINEGNIYRNFIYRFSTGPVLDSLSFSGKVVLAETGKTDSTLIVLLHRNLADSAVRRQRPVYIARVDAQGAFRFQNLPKGTFAVYALGDAGYLKTYTDSTKLFAFADSAIVTGASGPLTLYAYRQRPPQTNTPAPAAQRNNTAGERRLRFTPTPAAGLLDLQAAYVLNFQTPLRRFDSALLTLSTDSTFTAAPFTVALDSARTALTIRSAWKEGTRYNLILNKEFAEDTSSRKLLKTDTLNFTTKKRGDYARLNIRLRNADATKNPVLLFVQNDAVVFAAPVKGGVISLNLFNPGEYELRLLYDTNNNGKWDPGRFSGVKKQPELVKPIERRINVKAAWDNEFDVSL